MCKKRQKRKFDTLLERADEGVRCRQTDQRWVVNLSSRLLSRAEEDVLARGLNFAPAPKKVPVAEIVATVEDGLRRTGLPQAQLARAKIVGCLNRAKPPPTNLCPAEHKAIKKLKEDESIVIAPADKGSATVVMNRKEYDEKIRTLLTDSDTYRRLVRDPTPSQERKLNALLLPLMRAGSIPERLYYHLRSSAGKIPLLYGLPKIHKPGTPLRPIVSFVNSPTYALSKHLVHILSPLVGKSPSHVKNSAEFASFIAGQTLGQDVLLVSFDVVSLFTKVPVNLATKVAHERLSRDPLLAERTALSPGQVVGLLQFCLNATYLSYRGEMFQQVYGTAMGSPVSVTVANLVMEDVEQRALTSSDYQPPFWKRYVDDTITALPQDQIQGFHDHLNSIEPTIQFTIETEVDGTLPFLDTRVTRHTDGSLSTTVFRKKTHTDRYLDFDSHHPLAHKIAVTRTLLTRADRICTSITDRDAEKRHVSQALSNNGYPMGLVRKNWQAVSRPIPAPDHPSAPKATVVIPYVRHVSECIRRILAPLEIRTSFRPHHTLRHALVNLKDRIPLQQRAAVVYRIPCGTCSKVYVGQTGRTLDKRLKEHKRALTSGNLTQSAVAEHAAQESHTINWNEAQVVDVQPHYHQRCLLESWHIRTEASTMNRDEGTLPQAYNPLLYHPR